MALTGGHASVSSVGNGLWEIWTTLPTKRPARVLFCFYREYRVALPRFIKKTRAALYSRAKARPVHFDNPRFRNQPSVIFLVLVQISELRMTSVDGGFWGQRCAD